MIIDPRPLTVKSWCDLVALPLSAFMLVPVLQDESQWLQWALRVYENPSLSQFNLPDPRIFRDWKEWATRFNYAVAY